MYRSIVLFREPRDMPSLERVGGLARALVGRRSADQLAGAEQAPFEMSLECWFAQASDMQKFIGSDLLPADLVLGAREHVIFERPGGTSLKAMFVFRRHESLDLSQFHDYWLNRHGPIVVRTPELNRYVQCHVMEQISRNGEPPYDGVTELFWADFAAARRSMGSTQMVEEQSADARRFVRDGSIQVVLMNEEMLPLV